MSAGIYLLHKPVGPTSFSLVQEFIDLAKAMPGKGRPRVCHGGTLDPFASGLLLMLTGPATRLFDHLHSIPKVYEATARWGIETDNGDPHGKILSTNDTSTLSPDRLEDALKTFIGWREQVPHATSAKRIGGERAYLKAHRGEQVVVPPSRVYLHEATWLDHDLPDQSRLRLTVRGGFYVRALARDLGKLLGCGAHLTQLWRSSIGPWKDPLPAQRTELHGRDLLPWAPVRILTDQEVGELRQDRPVATGEILPPDWKLPEGFPDPQAPIRAFHRQKLVYLLKLHEQRLSPVSALGAGL